MKKETGCRLQKSAAGLILALAVSAGLTGCGNAVEDYSVEGRTGEVSMVTDEPFSDIFATMEYAKDEDVEGSLTMYGQTSESPEGETGGAAEEEAGRKWRTILENVSLFDSPKDGKVLMVVPKGSRVDVLTKKKDGWYKIRYRGTAGYVKSGYFVEDWEAEREERLKREEEEAKKKAEEEAKKKAEAEAKKKAEEEKKRKAEEAKKKKAEEEARKKAEEEAKKKAEEEAKKKAAEEKKKAEEAKKKAEEEKKKKEEEAKKKAEEEKKKKAEEEKKKKEEEERQKERARAMANREVTRRLAETVNLRDPDDPDTLFGVVPTGSTVTILADLGDGWYLVDYDGMEGMIKGGYFTEDDP